MRAAAPGAAVRLLEREDALAAVGAAAAEGRDLLVHGPSGVGKSAVLWQGLAACPRRCLFCDALTPAALYRQALARILDRGGLPSELSSRACRYRVLQLAEPERFCLVWDPAPVVSRVWANELREWLRGCRMPLLATARSAHMEDTGFLSIFFTLQSERLELVPLSPAAARQFAAEQARRLELDLSEGEATELLAMARGLPGEIGALLAMCREPRYRSGGRIKLHTIYLDRITGARVAAGSRGAQP